MSRQLGTVINKVTGLRTELFRAHSSFRAFEVIQESRAPNIVGKSVANKNAVSIGSYRGFFNIAEHALFTEFLVALAKLYDRHPQATSIPKLINYIRSNINHLTVQDFSRRFKHTPDLEYKISDYVGVKESDLKRAEDIINRLSRPIKKLKKIRDKRIAHLEIKSLDELQQETEPKNIKAGETRIDDLTHGEILKLIEAANQILNNLSSLIYKDVAWFEPLKESVTNDSVSLISKIASEHPQ